MRARPVQFLIHAIMEIIGGTAQRHLKRVEVFKTLIQITSRASESNTPALRSCSLLQQHLNCLDSPQRSYTNY